MIDQSAADETAAVVGEFAGELGAQTVRCAQRGVGLARNLGLSHARQDLVLMTDDDCTVAPDWVGIAHELASSDPARLFTGRVLAATDDMTRVPSAMESLEPHDYTGERTCFALYTGNAVFSRSAAIALGGFDERLETAEDNDFGYRWLRAGRPMSFEPRLVVWHHDWRAPEELEHLYVTYWRGQGKLYAKHLRSGDLSVLRFLAGDVRGGLRAVAARVLRGRPRWSDPRRGMLRGLPAGLVAGWRAFRKPG